MKHAQRRLFIMHILVHWRQVNEGSVSLDEWALSEAIMIRNHVKTAQHCCGGTHATQRVIHDTASQQVRVLKQCDHIRLHMAKIAAVYVYFGP